MKALIVSKLVIMATLFVGSVSLADAKSDAEKAAAEKETARIVELLLQKIGAVQELNFDLNVDTSLGKLPLNDSMISLAIPMTGSFDTTVGTGESKPSVNLGQAGIVLRAEATLKRANSNVDVQALLNFKDSQATPTVLPISVAIAKYPTLKFRLKSLIIKTQVSASQDASSNSVPLGDIISGSCSADIMAGSATVKGVVKETWKPMTECSFSAVNNVALKKYDVKMHLKNN